MFSVCVGLLLWSISGQKHVRFALACYTLALGAAQQHQENDRSQSSACHMGCIQVASETWESTTTVYYPVVKSCQFVSMCINNWQFL